MINNFIRIKNIKLNTSLILETSISFYKKIYFFSSDIIKYKMNIKYDKYIYDYTLDVDTIWLIEYCVTSVELNKRLMPFTNLKIEYNENEYNQLKNDIEILKLYNKEIIYDNDMKK